MLIAHVPELGMPLSEWNRRGGQTHFFWGKSRYQIQDTSGRSGRKQKTTRDRSRQPRQAAKYGC